MTGPLEFIVGFPIRGSGKSKAIALDRNAMALLGVNEGDTVYVGKRELFGIPLKPEVALRVFPIPEEDAGKRLARFTDDVTEFEYGDRILVYSK